MTRLCDGRLRRSPVARERRADLHQPRDDDDAPDCLRSIVAPRHADCFKQSGHGVRLLVCSLPTKSPWLNPIEPKWLAGKKRVAEPARLLSAAEMEDRVCAAFGCAREPHLIQPRTDTHKSNKAA